MSPSPHQPPESLRRFDELTGPMSGLIHDLDEAALAYRELREAGRILSNSIEALRVELTYHSNAIEGCTLSLRDTQLVLEGLSPAGTKPLREIYEARNHDRALRIIEQWAARSNDAPLTPQDLLEVHSHVLADIDPRSAGRFRSERVLIKGTRFVPPSSLRFDDLLPAMLSLAERSGIHPALQAAELHYNLVAVHPFIDGNGRTGRLLMNHHLLRHGYPLTIIEVDRRTEYLASLDRADEGDCGPLATIVLGSTLASIRRLTGER